MAASSRGADAPAAAAPEKSYFETQREALVREIAVSLENVLQNMNKLNRSLEGVIAVGNEFSSVEALWSQFENVMAPQPAGTGDDEGKAAEGEREGSEEPRPQSKG